MSNFELELRALLNKYSKESASATPDFILTSFLIDSLDIFNKTIKLRAAWYSNGTPTMEAGAIPMEVESPYPRR